MLAAGVGAGESERAPGETSTHPGACSNTPRAVRLPGLRAREVVLGRGPFLSAPFRRSAPIPRLLQRDDAASGPRYGAKQWAWISRSGPRVIHLSGWRVGARRERMRFWLNGRWHSRLTVRKEIVRRKWGPQRSRSHLFMPGAIGTDAPGCFVLQARWKGGRSRIGILIPKRPPPLPGPRRAG